MRKLLRKRWFWSYEEWKNVRKSRTKCSYWDSKNLVSILVSFWRRRVYAGRCKSSPFRRRQSRLQCPFCVASVALPDINSHVSAKVSKVVLCDRRNIDTSCRVWSVNCKVWSAKSGVQSVNCGVWSVKCRVWSVECKVWSVKCKRFRV